MLMGSDFVKKPTIRRTMLYVMLLVAIMPSIIIFSFYNYNVQKIMKERTISYSNDLINQVARNIDTILSQVITNQNQLISFAVTSELFQNYKLKTPKEAFQIMKDAESTLLNVRHSTAYIDDIYMISNDHRLFSTNTSASLQMLLDQPWIKKVIDKNTGFMVVPTHHANYENINSQSKDSGNLVISLVNKIIQYDKNNAIALIQTDIGFKEVESIMKKSSIDKDSFMIIVDENDNIVYCEEPEFVGKNLNVYVHGTYNSINTNNFTQTHTTNAVPVSCSLETVNWRVIGFISTKTINEKFNQINEITYLVAFLVVCIAILLSIILSREITLPLTNLVDEMKKVAKGKFKVSLVKPVYNELTVLTENFHRMVNQIDNLITTNLKKEAEKNDAKFEALQNQINPHFLYNTLNTIKWMALMENSENIANTIVALVKMLEYTYKNKSNMVLIKDEIDFIKNYVFIQKLRYGKNIEVIYEIDNKLYDLYSLKFILQPIVENSFIHGFSSNYYDYEGAITIEGGKYEDGIYFNIRDNGKGMDTSKVDKYSGIGIENVDNRIRMNFGEKYGISVISKIGEGTVVTVRIPEIKNSEEEQHV